MENEEFRHVYQVQVEMLQWFRTLKDWDIILSNEWKKVKRKKACVLTDTPKFPSDNSIHLLIVGQHLSSISLSNAKVYDKEKTYQYDDFTRKVAISSRFPSYCVSLLFSLFIFLFISFPFYFSLISILLLLLFLLFYELFII